MTARDLIRMDIIADIGIYTFKDNTIFTHVLDNDGSSFLVSEFGEYHVSVFSNDGECILDIPFYEGTL